MKNYIFNNTNNSIAYSSFKAFVNLLDSETEFNIIFDKFYDIFSLHPRISDKFYIFSDRHIVDNLLLEAENVLLDFELDFFLSNCDSYDQYITKKIPYDPQLNSNPIDVNPSPKIKNKVRNIFERANHNNFSYVLYAPLNMDLNKHDFLIVDDLLLDKTSNSIPDDVSQQLLSFLESHVNLISVTPSLDFEVNITELIFLVKNCDFVISNLDVLHSISIDQQIPSFLNLAKNTKYYQKDKLCTVYDPERNNKKIVPPQQFTCEYEKSTIHNNQILNYDIEKMQQEILKSFDFHKIPYQS